MENQKKSKWQIFLPTTRKREFYWTLISEENWIVKVREENWTIHRVSNFNNIVEIPIWYDFKDLKK